MLPRQAYNLVFEEDPPDSAQTQGSNLEVLQVWSGRKDAWQQTLKNTSNLDFALLQE